MSKRRWLAATLLILMAGTVAALLFSETALRAGARIAERQVDGLELDRVRGRLLTGVRAERVHWQDDRGTTTVTVTGFTADWRALPALVGRLHLGTLRADSVAVGLPARDPEAAVDEDRPLREFTLPRIEIPVVARIRELSVGEVTIARGGAVLLRIDAVTGTDLYADRRTFSAAALTAVGEQVSLEAAGSVQPAGGWPTELTVTWRAAPADLPPLSGTAHLNGVLGQRIAIHAEVAGPDLGRAHFDGELLRLLREPRIRGHLEVADGALAPWWAGAPDLVVGSAVIEVDGGYENLAATGRAALALPDWPAVDTQFDLRWGRQLLAVRSAVVQASGLPTRIEASGRYDWSDARPAGVVDLSWTALHWPLDGEPLLHSDDGRLKLTVAAGTVRGEVDAHLGDAADGRVGGQVELHRLDGQLRGDAHADWRRISLVGLHSEAGRASVQGALDEWTGVLDTSLTPGGMPPMQIAAELAGEGDTLTAHVLDAAWLDGTAAGSGRLTWVDGLAADVNLQIEGMDPAALAATWPGTVSGLVQAAMTADDDGIRWSIQVREASGRLRDLPMSANADLGGRDAEIDRVDATVGVGDARATLRGRMAPDFDFDWSVAAPDLGEIWPQAAGTVSARGTLRGSVDEPVLAFELDGGDFRFDAFTLARIEGGGTIDLAGTRASDAVLRLEELKLHERAVEQVELRLSGPRSELAFTVDAKVDIARIEGGVRGAWTDGRFDGRLERLTLSHHHAEPWAIDQPVEMAVSADAFRLARTCWRPAGAPGQSLCLTATWQADAEASASAELVGLPLDALSEWLPIGFQYTGRLSGTADLDRQPGAPPRVQARLEAGEGTWLQTVDEELVALLSWNHALLEGRLEQGTLDATAHFALVDGGRLDATVELPVFDTPAGPYRGRPFRAQFTGDFSSFDLLPAFIPDIGSVSGRVRADLGARGTLDNPTFSGTLVIEDGSTTIPRLGLRLTDFGLALDGGRDGLRVRSQARSGDGLLELDGRFAVRDGRLGGSATLNGEDFLAANIPEARVHISPRLTMELDGRRVSVEGEVRVPRARLEPRDFTAAIAVSDDEILIDDPVELDEAIDRWRIFARVRMVLGDVHFEGFGLTGRITGSLTAIDEPEQLTRATGELQIQEGRYAAWGQELEIERGRLVFTGGPIIQPGLDIRAVRRPPDILVGINVRGTLAEPDLTLFSEPAMQQAELLSWLVLGMPLTQTTGTEQQLLDRTAGQAGLAGGELVLRQLTQRLGLEGVAIERGDTPDRAALVIGRYLSPRVYVGYGIGLLDPATSLRVRYHIDANWSIEAQTGSRATSTDLKFTFER